MTTSYNIEVSEEDLLFQIELIAITYCGAIKGYSEAISHGAIDLLGNSLIPRLAEALRSLLRSPLQDPRFRRVFNDTFQQHEMPAVREVALPWMEEVLVWESD